MNPKISVVMIFLNAERFIRDSIASVLQQSRTDWELLLVDDGSTDASTGYAKAAAASDPRIRYIDHPGHVNLGLAATRNRGLEEARGDYILYLDSDDILFPEGLERMAASLDGDPAIAITFTATLFWNWDAAMAHKPDVMQDYRIWADRTLDGTRFLAAMTANESLHPANCGTMARRRTLIDLGGFTLGVPGIYEDTALLSIVLLEHRAHVSHECHSAYRMHASSHCHTAEAEGDYGAAIVSPAQLRYLAWLEGYLAARGALSAQLAHAIEAARAYRPHRKPGEMIALALRDPISVVRKLRPRLASTAVALRELERFHEARGDAAEVDRLRTRRAGWPA